MKKVNPEIYWQESFNVTKDVSTLSAAIMKQFDDKVNLRHYQKILLMFVQRIHINYVAIENLMPLYRDFQSLNFAILTLLRPLLGDFLLELYLLKKSTKENGIDESEFLNLFNGLTISSLEKMNRSLNNEKPNSELRSIIVESLKKFKPTEKIQLTPKDMWEGIRKSTLNDYEGAYLVYSVLSQLEHYTSVSEKFMTPDLKSTYQLINVTSEYIVNGILFSLHLCKASEDLVQRTVIILQDINKKSKRLLD